MSQKSEFDAQTFKKMKEELQQTYEEKVEMLTHTYQQCLGDLQNQYKQNQDMLEVMYQNQLKKHNQLLHEQNEAFKKVEVENKMANAERQKLQLESKKLMKMRVSQQEVQQTAPQSYTNGIEYKQEHKIATTYMQQKISTKSTTSSQYGTGKKKAADFYFQKNKVQEQNNKQPLQKRNSDFITRDISPQQTKKKSLERKNTYSKREEASAFTYDRPTQSATNRAIATANQLNQVYSGGGSETYSPTNKLSPRRSPMNGRKSKPDPSAWKNGVKKQDGGSSAPHRAYVPPALAKQQQDEPFQPAPYKSVAETKPDLPQKLVDEFKAQPKNYPGLIPALHDGDNFAKCLEKWNQLGVLYAEDVIRNAPAHCPVDYHLRVSENDTQSAFGQVDKNGRMQGLGRECHDFIYEGQFKDNVYHGWGRYISSQGVYWGLFNMGLRHGHGKWVAASGEQKEGNWVNGHLK